MFAGLVHAVLDFVARYGYFAVFAYMLVETANLLPFVPSEVVVPIAADQLVHGPVSFALFVADATSGATTGCLLAYVLFGRYGERLLDRHGHLVSVSERDLDRSRAFFSRYGESTVFWGRLLPVLRGIVSIPAGIAEMDLWRFTLYSAAGAGLFNTTLTYLVYTHRETDLSLDVAGLVGYVRGHATVTAAVVGAAVVGLAVLVVLRERTRRDAKPCK